MGFFWGGERRVTHEIGSSRCILASVFQNCHVSVRLSAWVSVWVHLMLLRPNRTHTRRIGLREVNSNYPVGVSSVYCPRIFSFLSPFLSGLARGLSALCGCLRPCACPAVLVVSLSSRLFLSLPLAGRWPLCSARLSSSLSLSLSLFSRSLSL